MADRTKTDTAQPEFSPQELLDRIVRLKEHL
jgi:hypothetical protein